MSTADEMTLGELQRQLAEQAEYLAEHGINPDTVPVRMLAGPSWHTYPVRTVSISPLRTPSPTRVVLDDEHPERKIVFSNEDPVNATNP